MGKSIRFQFYMALPNLGVLTAILAIVLGLNLFSGGKGFFASYFTGLPMMFLMLTLVSGSNLSQSQLQMGLSMGARRRDFFWAAQVTTLSYTAILSAFHMLVLWAGDNVSLLQEAAGVPWRIPVWLFAVCCQAMTLCGIAAGFAIQRSKAVGAAVMVVIMLLGMGLFIGLMVAGSSEPTWGLLPEILLAAMIVLAVAAEIIVWRGYRKAVVR